MIFDISTVLSISTPMLLSRKGMDGIYEILDHMTGTSLFTHQLPGAAKICRPSLFKQFPSLNNPELLRRIELLKVTAMETQGRERQEKLRDEWIDAIVADGLLPKDFDVQPLERKD